jgi:hypothetical protein
MTHILGFGVSQRQMDDYTDCQPIRGHAYSGISTQGNARIHLGDAYNYGDASNHSHNYYFYSSSTQQSLKSLTLCGHGIASTDGDPLSLKRKRYSDANEHRQRLNEEESLQRVLSKLGKFSKSIQDQRIGKDAKKVARRVAVVIDALKTQGNMPQDFKLLDTEEHHDGDDFESIDNSLIVTKRVDINTDFRRTRHTKLTRIVRKHNRIACEQWDISLRTTNFEFRNEDGTQATESLSSLYLEPRFTGAGFPVTVHFGETTVHSAVRFINPIISAYRMVPDVSEVFAVVSNDDLAGLLTLLADGKATLRDCDEEGATLLHVGQRPRKDMRPD